MVMVAVLGWHPEPLNKDKPLAGATIEQPAPQKATAPQ
jgi:hypothetical protein